MKRMAAKAAASEMFSDGMGRPAPSHERTAAVTPVTSAARPAAATRLPTRCRTKSFCPMRPSGESHFSKSPCKKPPRGGGFTSSSNSAAISLRFSSSASNSCKSSAALWRGRASPLGSVLSSMPSLAACGCLSSGISAMSRLLVSVRLSSLSSPSSSSSPSMSSEPSLSSVGRSFAFSEGSSISSSAASLEKLSRLRRSRMLSVSSAALPVFAIGHVSPSIHIVLLLDSFKMRS